MNTMTLSTIDSVNKSRRLRFSVLDTEIDVPMKRIFIILLLCLSALAVSAASQETPTGVEELGYDLSPRDMLLMQISIEELLRAESHGQLASVRFAEVSEEEQAPYQAALGMTAEQVTSYAQKYEEFNAQAAEVVESFDETMNRFDELSPDEQTAFGAEVRTTMRTLFAEQQEVLTGVLTPAQIQRMQELELVLPSVVSQVMADDEEFIPVLNFAAYEALGLSEEQKEALARIQEESAEEMGDLLKEKMLNIRIRVASDDPPSEETLQAFQALSKRGRAMKARLKAKIHALLTKEQTAKLEKLLADWPAKLEQIRADWKAAQAKKKPEDDSWREAWKPGDPVPEGAAEPERRFRFD